MLAKMAISQVLILVVLLCGCRKSPYPFTENVLSEGMVITASTPSGKISIEGQKGCSRRFSGENWSCTSALIPRDTRWYGSLGLYDPAPSNSMHGRLLVDEGRQFFSSESEVLRYLQQNSGYFGRLTYNNSGLVVAYKIIPIPGGSPTRSLEVWQVYINGHKPSSLRGAMDANITISGGQCPDAASPFPAVVGYERELADKEYDADDVRAGS